MFARTLQKKWDEVSDKDFRDQSVLIDNHRFIRCTFTNCVFEYHGGDWRFTECTINEPFAVDFKGFAHTTLNFIDYIQSLDKSFLRRMVPEWF